jgi:hypothetical protein
MGLPFTTAGMTLREPNGARTQKLLGLCL